MHGNTKKIRVFILICLAALGAVALLTAMVTKSRAEQAHDMGFAQPAPLPDEMPFTGLNPDAPQDFQVVTKSSETQGIYLAAEMRRSYLLGTPILLKLTLQNRRNEHVQFNHSLNESDFYFRLTDAHCQPIPMTSDGKKWLGASLYEQTGNIGMIFKAGQSVTRQVDLTKYFRIESASSYRLSVVRTVLGTDSYPFAGMELEVDIDSIIFNVKEREK